MVVYMLFDLDEVFDVVERINSELFEKCGDGSIELLVETNGTSAIISFCNVKIWFSEHDEREIGSVVCESLMVYLKRRVNEIIGLIIKINSI